MYPQGFQQTWERERKRGKNNNGNHVVRTCAFSSKIKIAHKRIYFAYCPRLWLAQLRDDVTDVSRSLKTSMLPTRGELGKPMIIQACSSPNADNASLARIQPARPIVKHAYRRMPRRFTQENSTFLRIIARSIVGSASVNFFPLCLRIILLSIRS